MFARTDRRQMTRTLPIVGLLIGITLGCSAPPPAKPNAEAKTEPVAGSAPQERPEEQVEIHSYHDVQALFEKLSYTQVEWQAGIREVPRIYLTDIPPRWREKTSKEITVRLKKELFFRVMAPLILRSNELILSDRDRVESLRAQVAEGRPLTDEDSRWLRDLAVGYRVIDDGDVGPLGNESLSELLQKVDIIPVSLALSQAAEESGWGTSRFAAEGNALFGQWTWGEDRIKPKEQREELGNYGIAAFETPLLSMVAYMRNLNTHPAYDGLREKRAALRGAGEPLSGRTLAETLTSYSERGSEYVESLHAIMRVNRLDPADDAYLGDGPDVLLIPVAGTDD